MTEIEIYLELYYKTAMEKIQQERARYLKGQKSVPFKQYVPYVREACAQSVAQMSKREKRKYFATLKEQKKKYNKALKKQKRPMEEQLTKGYNAGIEQATMIFQKTFFKFIEKVKADMEE